MFAALSEQITGVVQRLRGRGVLSESDVTEALREIRRHLLEADVSFEVTRGFVERVRERAVGALEIKAEAILKGTKVDGVYDSDPNLNPNAQKFDALEYLDVLNRGLTVMDATAISLCMENNLPILVFNFRREGNIKRALLGEPIGTLVHDELAALLGSRQRDLEAHVGLEQVAPDFAQRLRDVAFREHPATAQPLQHPGDLLGEGRKHKPSKILSELSESKWGA